MCAKVKMLTAINSSVNCTLVLIKHKYSKCIQRILSLPGVKCETAAPARNARCTTGNTPALQNLSRCGMVLESRRVATSLQTQPGSKPAIAESSGQLTEAA
jgi:hypothetical protein